MRVFGAIVVTTIFVAAPAIASQFVEWPIDKVIRESEAVVHGNVGRVWSSWDEEQKIIFTYAEVHVTSYLAGDGDLTLVVKEAGGTVDDYTMEAIGFPVLRGGEEVVLFLTRWTDSGHHRIQAFRQGKYVVSLDADGNRVVALDAYGQGDDRLGSDPMPTVPQLFEDLQLEVEASHLGRLSR